ncbi:hypothetical protein BDB01DRAFT_793447 [Pilobolus umbonatus]|nr:hypothetical protein BDB01DRAFT_793447 [Pilobolus umbonatus]
MDSPLDINRSDLDVFKGKHRQIYAPDEYSLLTQKVETILCMNQEIIRLCIEHHEEPNLSVYQLRLQSNLTYLATIADISLMKPGEVRE